MKNTTFFDKILFRGDFTVNYSKKLLIIDLLYFFTIIIILFNVFRIFAVSISSNQYQISVSSKNKEELIEMLEEIYEEPEKVTKIKLKIKLGDGDIYLYNNFNLMKKISVSESNSLFQYVLKNGTNPSFKFIIYIIITLLFLLVLETYKYDVEEEKTTTHKNY